MGFFRAGREREKDPISPEEQEIVRADFSDVNLKPARILAGAGVRGSSKKSGRYQSIALTSLRHWFS